MRTWADNLAPADPREAATLQTLAPGNYTAIVPEAGGSAGVGLVEVYNVQLPRAAGAHDPPQNSNARTALCDPGVLVKVLPR